MKRKDERVPGFDEVIFRNRNKEYGAFELRKSYTRRLGISLLIVLALAVTLVVLPSLTVKNSVVKPPVEYIQAMPDPDLLKAIQTQPVEKKQPIENVNFKSLVVPVVVSEGEEPTNTILTNDEALTTIHDGNATEVPEGNSDMDPAIIPPEPLKPFVTVQEMPVFPGGEVALLKFISDNLIYPQEAIDNNVQGKITVRFVVAPTGSVKDVAIFASQGTALDLSILEQEATRVVQMLPRFKPGKQDGVAVPVYFNVPVVFAIK
jgi:periplasmic protein TonB